MSYQPIAGWWEANPADFIPRNIVADDIKPRDTGLLDRNGTKLFFVSPPRPVGFVKLKEVV